MLIVQTGVRWYHEYPNEIPPLQIHSLVLDEHPDEFDPEDVFLACNRIESPMFDIERIACTHPDRDTIWMQKLRAGLDACKAPSMSGGDVIHVFTHQTGRQLGYWDCKSIGWEFAQTLGFVQVPDVINHTHTHHID